MFEIMFGIWDAVEPVVVPLLVTVGTATGVSILTPNSSTIKIIDIILKVLNAISGNILQNKNKDDK